MTLPWQSAQKQFESFWLSKRQYCYAFEDTREAMGLSGSRKVFTKARPSDYLLTHSGMTSFAEVKSSQSLTSFNLNNVAKEQWKAAIQVTAAGGSYRFFIRRESDKQWFNVDGKRLIAVWQDGKRSIKWIDLEPYKWSANV